MVGADLQREVGAQLRVQADEGSEGAGREDDAASYFQTLEHHRGVHAHQA